MILVLRASAGPGDDRRAAETLRPREEAARTCPRPGGSPPPGLIVVAAAVPMAAAAAVNAVTPSARVLAPQVTALAPLAVFHDLRWLFAFGGTWPRFALALAGLVVARSVLDAALAWLAWPRGQARPRPAILFGSGAVLTLSAGLLMSPVVTLTFGVALLPFSWPFLGRAPDTDPVRPAAEPRAPPPAGGGGPCRRSVRLSGSSLISWCSPWPRW